MIVSNHHQLPLPGEDYQTFEKDLPGDNTTGWGGAPIRQLARETNDTTYPSGSWGFNIRDMEPKNLKELIHYMVRTAGNDANFLLNIGPMPNGQIQPAFADRLHEMGKWMAAYGDSIYGTRGGPVKPGGWGATTQRTSTLYVHVLDPLLRVLALPGIAKPPRDARLLNGGTNVDYCMSEGTMVLQLPPGSGAEFDQVIVLDLGP